MVITCRLRVMVMHTAGKVMLIIGGIITVIGVVMIVGGAVSAELNPESENVWEGTSGEFTIPDDDIYGIYTSAGVNCDDIIDPDDPQSVGSISIDISYSGENQFVYDCEFNSEDDYLNDDYQRVGDITWLCWAESCPEAGDTVTINSDVTIYIVGDIEAFGDAAGGILTAAGGVLVAICGGVILLIGLILALTLKEKNPVIMQQGQMMGGQMMGGQMPMQQQMPAQQMPAQTTAQPYEYEQK